MRYVQSIAGRLMLVIFALSSTAPFALCQTTNATDFQRSYPYSEASLKQALGRMSAFAGARLPMIDGFVAGDTANLELYKHPYYQYRIDLAAIDATHTRLSVKAKISAWYADPTPGNAGYRSLASSGRLESDLLDRLEEALNPKPAHTTDPPRSADTLSATKSPVPNTAPVAADHVTPAPEEHSTTAASATEMEKIRDDRKYVDQRIGELSAQIKQMEEALRSQTDNVPRLADVKRSGSAVMTRMSDGGPVLFRARAQDEFEVVQQQGEWSLIKVSSEAVGWIRSEQLNIPSSAGDVATKSPETPTPADAQEETALSSTPLSGVASAKPYTDLGFWVSRETTDIFRGDWEPLKDKQVLFVFVQPRSALADVAHDDRKLKFIKQVFADPNRTATLVRDNLAGVVIIFLGGKSAVAAASLSDMKQWARGALNDTAFFHRCSLDPPEEFAASPAMAAGINGQ